MNYDSLKDFYIGRTAAVENNKNLTDKARQSIYVAHADNTVAAYASDWKDFVTGVRSTRYHISLPRRRQSSIT